LLLPETRGKALEADLSDPVLSAEGAH
jgi:hypothetical protein